MYFWLQSHIFTHDAFEVEDCLPSFLSNSNVLFFRISYSIRSWIVSELFVPNFHKRLTWSGQIIYWEVLDVSCSYRCPLFGNVIGLKLDVS